MSRQAIHDAAKAQAYLAQMDAGETLFFARELELVEAQTYDAEYPEAKGRTLFDRNPSPLGPADEYWTYRGFDRVNGAIEASMDSDMIPQVELAGAEAQRRVVDLLIGYGYTV